MARLRIVKGDESPDTFGVFFEWRSWALLDVAEKTVQEYGKVLWRFFAETGIPFQDVRLPDLVHWMSSASVNRPGEALSPAMAALARQAFAHFYRYCLLAGYLEQSPAVGLPVRHGRVRLPEHLTWEELTMLTLGALSLQEPWAWLILCFYVTGARVSEMAAVRPDRDLVGSPGQLSIVLRHTKRRPHEEEREREVPLSFPASSKQAVPFGAYDLGERVFTEALRFFPYRRANVHSHLTLFGVGKEALWERVSKAGRAAGLPQCKSHPHILRGTFCTHLLEAGVDPYVVQRLMGHAKVETTMKHYAAVTDPRRRQAISNLGRWERIE